MATASVSIREYLQSDYEPDAEYVDGEIEERAVGEYDHATWQYAIQMWFALHQKKWDIRVRCELRVQVSPTRFRVPDVTVFHRSLPIEQILTVPPIAVFEILSPEDRMDRVLRKLADYEAMGIATILVIDPKDSSVRRYQHGDLLQSQPETLDGSPCRLDWQQIRSYLD